MPFPLAGDAPAPPTYRRFWGAPPHHRFSIDCGGHPASPCYPWGDPPAAFIAGVGKTSHTPGYLPGDTSDPPVSPSSSRKRVRTTSVAILPSSVWGRASTSSTRFGAL